MDYQFGVHGIFPICLEITKNNAVAFEILPLFYRYSTYYLGFSVSPIPVALTRWCSKVETKTKTSGGLFMMVKPEAEKTFIIIYLVTYFITRSPRFSSEGPPLTIVSQTLFAKPHRWSREPIVG